MIRGILGFERTLLEMVGGISDDREALVGGEAKIKHYLLACSGIPVRARSQMYRPHFLSGVEVFVRRQVVQAPRETVDIEILPTTYSTAKAPQEALC